MSPRGRSLRATLTWATLVLGGVALAAVLMVIVLTTLLHRASIVIEAATHSVHAAQEAQVDLLLHERAKARIVRRKLSGSVHKRLSEAEAYVSTEHEGVLLSEAKSRVEEYILASGDEGRPEEEVAALHAAAFSAIEDLVIENVAQAREEAARAARVDYLANISAVALAFLVLGTSAFIFYSVRGPLIRPVWELGQAMDTFAHGVHSTRANVTGPRELKEIAERFNEMAAQIERQRERQHAFLAGVAHDLRNPVSTLLLAAEVARSDGTLPADHRLRRVLERNARQLRNLDRMIADLMDAAAIEAGELELRLEVCDLRDPLLSAAELFEGTSPRHRIVSSLPREPVRARLDPMRIEQVVTNLLSNAIKYSPDGGQIDLRLEGREGGFLIEVSDHGLGMSREAQSSLFQPFSRGPSQEGIRGVGLGLFVVRRIVEAHQGRIEVESAPGVGSTFRVFLPADSPEPSSHGAR